MTHWPHGDPEAVARAVVAQPAYRVTPTSDAPPPGDFWGAFVSLLQKYLAPLFNWIHGAVGGSKPLGVALGMLILILALAGIAFLIVRIVDALTGAGEVRAGAGRRHADALAELRSAGDWRAAADRAAAQGDYARAIGALFSAALFGFDEAALVEFDAARTPGEYRRIVRRVAAGKGDAFDALAQAFVCAAFAGREVEREDFARALAAYESLERPVAA